MEFAIHPLKGVNDIQFGMTEGKVRELMRGATITTRRGDIVNETGHIWASEIYYHEGVRFDYDEGGHLEAAEFFKPAVVLIGGVRILDLSFGQALSTLARIDPNIAIEEDGATSFELALGIWVEDAGKGANSPIETFLVGRPGYYDFLRQGTAKPS